MEAWGRATVWFAEEGGAACEIDALVFGPFAIMPTVRSGQTSPEGEPLCEPLSPFRGTLWPAPDEWMIVHRTRHRIVGHCPTEEQARAFCEAALAAHGGLWELDEFVGSEQREHMKAWQISVSALYFWPVAPGAREV